MPISKQYHAAPIFNELGEGFADQVTAALYPNHTIRFRNDRAATEIGLGTLTDQEWAGYFANFKAMPDNLPIPLAQRYHGHQFRTYNPDLGDGRGFLYAQLRDNQQRIIDLTTKGSGTTPYSRAGDGKLTLKGGVREILASEMLEALGTNTSRTLSIIETGEKLYRTDEPSPTRSAVMVRMTHSNIRIGTFQRHAYHSDRERLEKLTHYCLKHYYNAGTNGTAADCTLRLLGLVSERVANQAADLMVAGFVHGVLNTDNICITGEIFDFGPWRFLPHMDLSFTAAYFDETKLYAYGRQPAALHWNIYQLGGALADIADEKAVKSVLEDFPRQYFVKLRQKLLARLGLKPKGDDGDDALLKAVNDFMIAAGVPYEHFFYDWFGGARRNNDSPLDADVYRGEPFETFQSAISDYNPMDKSLLDHAYFQRGTPCTLLIEEVESLWASIADDDNWQPLYDKIEDIRMMGDALKLRP